MVMCLSSGAKGIVVATFLAVRVLFASEAPPPIKPNSITVTIDPGHGGNDFGALGAKEQAKKKGAKATERLVEKKIALQLAKLLGEHLKKQGCIVHYTRSTDIAVPLLERAKIANRNGSDIFVSIHFNANPNKKANGSEVFFLSLGPVDEEMQALADSENEDEVDVPVQEVDILAGILEDLAQKAFLHESERMAVCIQTELNCLAGIKERGVKQAPFAVLRTAAMPAVLVETAFISNPSEARKLRDPAFLESAAQAIAKGIQHYIESAGSGRTRRKTL
jgi:N-acetylmuramoyl-L-alanine amidase